MSELDIELNAKLMPFTPYSMTNKVSQVLLVKVVMDDNSRLQGWAEAEKFYAQLDKRLIELISEDAGVLTLKLSNLKSHSATFIMKRFIN